MLSRRSLGSNRCDVIRAWMRSATEAGNLHEGFEVHAMDTEHHNEEKTQKAIAFSSSGTRHTLIRLHAFSVSGLHLSSSIN